MEQNKAIAVHQPNFIPWLGYFEKIRIADQFVFYDNVEYSKNSFINRNRILSNNEVSWLTIPVKYSGKSNALINEIEIAIDIRGVKKILKSISQNYSKAPSFDKYFNDFSQVFLESCLGGKLIDINIALVKWANTILKIDTPCIFSSDIIDTNLGDPTERLIVICQKLNGKTYISGKGGFNYQKLSSFSKANITIVNNEYTPIEYSQLSSEFHSGLSVIDYIFNKVD